MRLRHAQRGQLIVEVAVVFPLLVLACLGLVQFALYYHAHNVVQAGVQEAARTMAARDGTERTARARGEALIAAGFKTPQPVEIEMDMVGPNDDIVQAQARTSYPTFFPAFSFSEGMTHVSLPINVTARVYKEQFRDRR
jgi:Flp pilus assembly protein TadG